MRVFVAGFQHETNTFAPSKADWVAFNAGSAYPPFTRGDAMLELIGRSAGLSNALLYSVTFDRCQSAPAVTAADFGCTVEACAGAEVGG